MFQDGDLYQGSTVNYDTKTWTQRLMSGIPLIFMTAYLSINRDISF